MSNIEKWRKLSECGLIDLCDAVLTWGNDGKSVKVVRKTDNNFYENWVYWGKRNSPHGDWLIAAMLKVREYAQCMSFDAGGVHFED